MNTKKEDLDKKEEASSWDLVDAVYEQLPDEKGMYFVKQLLILQFQVFVNVYIISFLAAGCLPAELQHCNFIMYCMMHVVL